MKLRFSFEVIVKYKFLPKAQDIDKCPFSEITHDLAVMAFAMARFNEK